MIGGKHSKSWQTIIADLALILFMVTAAAMERDGTGGSNGADETLPVRAEPLAVYRPGGATPPLRDWLEAQAADARQRLTVVARHAPGEEEEAARAALALAAGAGMEARIVIEPAERSEVLAVLAFDRGDNWHADCKQGVMHSAERAMRKDDPCE